MYNLKTCIHNCAGHEYNCLVDGGKTKHYSDVKDCLKKFGVMNGDSIQLHGIIVTHPDGDHLGGIKMLFEEYGQKILDICDIVITRAFFWRYYKDEMSKKFINLINTTASTREDIKVRKCITGGLQCHFPTELGCVYRNAQQKGRYIKYFFPKPDGINANKASILTTLNKSKDKCDVVLTGDLITKHIIPHVKNKKISIFQVPHHGDYWMSRLDDKHYIQKCTPEVQNILSKCPDKLVKETLLFYSTFRAQCYLISAGGIEPHPHYSVLQGIILANSVRCEECVILLTNSRALKLEKFKKLHHLAPQWTRYVKIHHYDDVFFTEQSQSNICLHPERCISDVRTNTIEWTPEGYVNALRVKLQAVTLKMSNRPPLEKMCFVERLVVQITIKESELVFNAHIVRVPLPHNPRSGDRINCCYVVEESIAPGAHFSQAQFLLDDGECRLSPRAKAYSLFQYTNNEWQIREVSANVTLQDQSLKTAHSVVSSVCCKCNDDITSLHDTASCHLHAYGCLSRAHAQCVRHRKRGAKSVTAFICPKHNTCCLCKKDIVRIHGTVSCNQQHLGCLNQAHAHCAGYRKRQASRVNTFACPNHTCCLCQKDITQDDDTVSCIKKIYDQQHLNRAHIQCASRYTKREVTFACPSHTCCLCKQDIFQDCDIVLCRQQHRRCLNQAHAQCAGYTEREVRSRVAMTFACPRHSCCLCEREIVKDYGVVSCKQYFTDQGCLNRAHAQCAGYKVRKANKVKKFSCPSCR